MGLANQNGLSGKYVSERHHYASQSKFTAGEAAKKIRQELKIKLSAKELVEGYELLFGREPEWHHSGFYKSSCKSTMGRTFFFSDEDIKMVKNRIDEIEVKKAERDNKLRKAAETIVCGFYYIWDYDYSGYRGKKRNYKVLRWYEGSELNSPKNFTLCEKGWFDKYNSVKASYYGWDEPTIIDIEKKLNS